MSEIFGFIIFAIGLGILEGAEASKRHWIIFVSFMLLVWGLDLLIEGKIRTAKDEIIEE